MNVAVAKQQSRDGQPYRHLRKDGKSGWMHRYGLFLSAALNDLQLELYCFKTGRTIEQGGVGRFGHFKRACSILMPNLKWNEWLEAQIQSLCDDHYAKKIGDTTQRHLTWAGCGSAGKTHAAALFAFIWFLADPHNSIVILTSTSAKMVRKRIWPVISSFYVQIRDYIGTQCHLIDSKTTIQAERGDDKHAIFAMAVGEGETSKAAANIQGMHAPRIFLVIDEATDVQEAILIAKENLKKSCQDFTELYIGNAKSRLDPLGQAMTPKEGWNSVTVDDEEWITTEGLCLHFDGFKSPNVKAKKTLHPYIYTWEDYLTDNAGGKQDTLPFWMYTRGFPPPDGISDTVVSEAMIETCGARGKHIFLSQRKTVAALDPAFGGDTCRLRFAHVGDIEGEDDERLTGIQLTEKFAIEADPNCKDPVDFQIARQVYALCKARGVQARDFGTDATGIGRGVYAKLYEIWSAEIHKVEFGGEASELPASHEDPRPGFDVYDRRVTELWFSIVPFLKSGQLKGLDNDVIREMCGRKYEMKNRRYSLETKDKFKSRFRKSPDDADCLAVLVSVIRSNGVASTSKAAKRDGDNWAKLARKYSVPSEFDADGTDNIEPERNPEEELFAWTTRHSI